MTDSSAPPNTASRKHPNASLARGMDELDAVGSLAIAKRSSRPPGPPPLERKTSPSAATLTGSSQSGEASGKSGTKSGGTEVSDGARSTTSRPSRVAARPRPSSRPAPEPSIWPQWLFAAAVLGAALWYLFSVEPPSKNSGASGEKRGLESR